MEKFVPEIFDFNIGGHDYTVEFNREAIKEGDSLGLTRDDSMGYFDLTKNILYVGLKKNHPHITSKRASEILEKALDEGYGLESFGDILNEFYRCYKAVFIESKGAKEIRSRSTDTAAAKK